MNIDRKKETDDRRYLLFKISRVTVQAPMRVRKSKKHVSDSGWSKNFIFVFSFFLEEVLEYAGA